MTKFLLTSRGGLVNADQIKEVQYKRHGAKAFFHDGESIELSLSIAGIEKELLPVVAATPGYMLLQVYVDQENDEPMITRTHIVAWRIANDIAHPVTPDNDDEECSNRIEYGVLLPDGQVIQPYLGAFANEESWRLHMAKITKERQSRVRGKEEPV